jgi:hypothetical protein
VAAADVVQAGAICESDGPVQLLTARNTKVAKHTKTTKCSFVIGALFVPSWFFLENRDFPTR